MTIQEKIESLKSELAETRRVWINLNQHSDDAAMYEYRVSSLEDEIAELESQANTSSAGELAQPSPDSHSVYKEEISPAALLGTATLTFSVGVRVKVKKQYSEGWGKVPKFAGQSGVIEVELPRVGSLSYGRFFSVMLDSGKVETYFEIDLELIPDVQVSKSHSQTDFFSDVLGLAEFVGKVKKAVKAKFSRRVDDSPPPVQTTLFELLKPYAVEQYKKMQALYQLYVKDLEQLKNPLSQLSKVLGKRRQSNLDGLSKQASDLARDLVAYGLMWELLGVVNDRF